MFGLKCGHVFQNFGTVDISEVKILWECKYQLLKI